MEESNQFFAIGSGLYVEDCLHITAMLLFQNYLAPMCEAWPQGAVKPKEDRARIVQSMFIGELTNTLWSWAAASTIGFPQFVSEGGTCILVRAKVSSSKPGLS